MTSGSSVPLYLFCGGAMVAISGMGGAYALLPAYEADLFGTKNIAAIHGRMLLASSSAALSGTCLNPSHLTLAPHPPLSRPIPSAEAAVDCGAECLRRSAGQGERALLSA